VADLGTEGGTDSAKRARATRTETQTVETAVAPDGVFAVLTDPRHIPAWAPTFIDAVVGDLDSGWVATKGTLDFPLRVVVNDDARTVDYLREISPGVDGGAYLRAMSRPFGGTVIVMTLPLLPGVDPAATAATLAAELSALASLLDQDRWPTHD
jgi:hypothetical protein